MKGQVLHLLRVQLKVPGDSSDFSVLLTKKSLMFLLRLNEMKLFPLEISVLTFRLIGQQEHQHGRKNGLSESSWSMFLVFHLA